MDVLAITCLAVIAVAAVVITWAVLGLANEARRTRLLLEDIATLLGATAGDPTVRAPDANTRPWVPADA